MPKQKRESELSNRKRLLLLMELLKKYTDREHQLTVQDIVDRFEEEYELTVKSTGIQNDLRELEKIDSFPVLSYLESNGLPIYYSYQNRPFEVHDLRMMIDAISSARFITKAETERIIGSLKKLTSVYTANQLENPILISEHIKSENRLVKYNITDLHEAIAEHNIVEFRYGRFNMQKKFVLSNEGNIYRVKPYALVWNNDYYYLIGEYIPKQQIYHYRIDRIYKNINKTEESFLPDVNFDVSKYTEKLFHMYAGEETSIEIEFSAGLINVVIDRFGRQADIRPINDSNFKLFTKGTISEGLIRWILTWGSDAKVMHPPRLVEIIKEEVDKLYKTYY